MVFIAFAFFVTFQRKFDRNQFHSEWKIVVFKMDNSLFH